MQLQNSSNRHSQGPASWGQQLLQAQARVPRLALALGLLVVFSVAAAVAHFQAGKASRQKVLVVHIREKDLLPSSYSATMSFSLQRPKFLLFGDSLTERGFSMGGWASGLAHHYYRKVDVLNRGLGGYNTRWMIELMQDIFFGIDGSNTKLVTVFLGANDAARPDGPPHSARQNVPLDEYKRNLKKICEYVRSLGIDNILILTPPPVYEEGRKEWQVVRVGRSLAAELPLDRTNDFTGLYAKAACAAAQELKLPCIDLWTHMQGTQGWQTLYFNDGLHFTVEGNQYVQDAILQALQEHYPSLNPVTMPLHFPPWDTLDPDHMEELRSTLRSMRKEGPFATRPIGSWIPGFSAAANNNNGTGGPAPSAALDTNAVAEAPK